MLLYGIASIQELLLYQFLAKLFESQGALLEMGFKQLFNCTGSLSAM